MISRKYPDLPNELIDESIDCANGAKEQQKENSIIREESDTIVEDGSEFFKYRRRIVKEDFSYRFNRKVNPTEDSTPPDTNRGDSPPDTRRSKGRKDPNSPKRPPYPTNGRDLKGIEEVRKVTNSPPTDRWLLSSERRRSVSAHKKELLNEVGKRERARR
jgi:hypothetical protein